MYVELERSHGGEQNVRDLYARMVAGKMKKKRAGQVWKRWREWEESVGNAKGVEKVKALEREYWEKKENEGGDGDEE